MAKQRRNSIVARAGRFADRFRIQDPKRFRLKQVDPGDTWRLRSKEQAAGLLEQGIERLTELQEMLYAQDRWSLLLVFQAMDAAGKDSTIKHVMSGVNPQGCQVHSFKQPSPEELDHDFLWRTTTRLPERGRIGIFNRSHYEEVLVVRVHPELLVRQKLPSKLIAKDIWEERFQSINELEQHLARNGTAVRKFFLHVSKDEQRKRFEERLDRPEKNWKFALGDVQERAHWDQYQRAYEDMIRNTSTPHAPWYVVPADHKWFTRLVVAAAVVDALEDLKLEWPKVDSAKRKELATAREVLAGED
ncbi:MAG: polyphosphate kinase 2 family protein [Deltaproteobacteria bacterium]|nr:polyphosphate kinase 2 family protein [Deltaproteobacteria bacterium]